MIPLRETTKRKVIAVLEKSYFSLSSFTVLFDENDREFLQITFLPRKTFRFVISGYGTTFSTSEAPGMHVLTGETLKREDLDTALKAIAPWINRILEDYRTQNPIVDEFETSRKSLNEKLEQHLNDDDSHFSAEEASAIRVKLDELSAKLAEVCEKNAEYEKNLRDAKAEIQSIKADLELFPKGVWYRMAGGKDLSVIKKVVTSKEGRDFALEAAKKLLLEAPK